MNASVICVRSVEPLLVIFSTMLQGTLGFRCQVSGVRETSYKILNTDT